MNKSRSLFLSLFVLLAVLLTSCTGVSRQKRPYDAEAIQGRKVFFNTLSRTLANFLITDGPGSKAQLYQTNAGKISEIASLQSHQVRFSIDESFAVLQGYSGIFEYASVTPETVFSGTIPLPANKIETYCSMSPVNGYTEFNVVSGNSGNEFVALSKTGKTTIGGNGLITRAEDNRFVSFQKSGFGTLQVDKQSPTTGDFYKASFVSAPEPWLSINDMTCYLNNAPVTKVLVSSTASAWTDSFDGDVNWTFPDYARVNDGFSAICGDNLFNQSLCSRMHLTGYFTNALPVTAVIEGIKVNCRWSQDASTNTVNNLLSLEHGGVAIGVNKATLQLLPKSIALSGDYGGESDLWSTSLTASQINDASFGIQLQFNDGPSGAISMSLDHCQIAVYWH